MSVRSSWIGRCRGGVQRLLPALVCGVLYAVAAGCSGPFGAEPTQVRLAGGEIGGFYRAFGDLLAQASDDRVHIVPMVTDGSRTNLEMLRAGSVDIGLALADSVPADSSFLAIGRVYENYVQLAVRADSPITDVAGLRGRRVNLGAEGSGAAFTGDRILRAAGLAPGGDVEVTHAGLLEAVTRLRDGHVDALLWAGGIPTAALDAAAPLRLIPLGDLVEPMRARYGPAYDRVRIPAGVYRGVDEVTTIGVPNYLLATAAMSENTAADIVDLILANARALVPADGAGTQYLGGRSLIATGDVPLHPGAARAYRAWHG